MKILIVDDSKEVSEPLKLILEKWGHIVTVADTGNKSLTIVKHEMFDLILLDIFLPDAMAYDLIPKFKNEWSGMDIITITGHSSIEIEEKIRRQGILYYMVKPINIQELNCILTHLEKSDPLPQTPTNILSRTE